MQSFDEVVLDRSLALEIPDHHADFEVDAGRAEGVEAHQGLLRSLISLRVLQHRSRHLERHGFYVLQIAVIAHADFDTDPQCGPRKGEVLHD